MERLSYYRPLFNIFKISCVKGENVNWCSKSKGTRSPQLHGVHQYHEHWSRYWCYIIIRILSYNLSAHSHYIHTTDDYWSKMEVNIEVFGHKHLNIWSDRPVQHIHITFHSSHSLKLWLNLHEPNHLGFGLFVQLTEHETTSASWKCFSLFSDVFL